jgi:glycosyltransferase involved in cell wall biosynthesis
MAASISVIIPVHNGERHVAEAITSILAQTHLPDEIIVVDDGSEDSTAAVMEGYADRVRLLRQPWLGAAAAVNAGLTLARSELIAFLDHDDIWLPNKLEVQTSSLLLDEKREATFGLMGHFISPDSSANTRATVKCPERPQPGVCRSVMLIRRKALDRIGRFVGGRDASGFPEWFTRARTSELVFDIPSVVVAQRRLHDTNATRSAPEFIREHYLDILHAAIRRKRGNSPSD